MMYPSRTLAKRPPELRVEKSLQIGEADARTRTADPFITSEVLYQLSYVGVDRILGRLVLSRSGPRADGLSRRRSERRRP